MGSRYGGLKQLDGVGPDGETILDYSVFDAIRAGFSKVVYIIREEFAEEFRDTVGRRFAEKIEVAYVFQDVKDLPDGFSTPLDRTRPWGTAHAAWAARKELDRPFALVNADDFYGADAFRKAAEFLGQPETRDGRGHFCMVGYELEKTLSAHGSVNRGLCETSGGRLEGVEEILGISRREDGVIRGEKGSGESISLDSGALVSMNMWGFHPSFVAPLEDSLIEFLRADLTTGRAECYIPAVVDSLIRSGRAECRVLPTDGEWFGVTYPGDREAVARRIAKLTSSGAYPSSLAFP